MSKDYKMRINLSNDITLPFFMNSRCIAPSLSELIYTRKIMFVEVFVNNVKKEIRVVTEEKISFEKIILTNKKVILFVNGNRYSAEVQGNDVFELEKGIYLCFAKMSTDGVSCKMTNTQFNKFVNGLKELYNE